MESVLPDARRGRHLLVSRHPGAIAWAQQQGIVFDQVLPHLSAGQVETGDRVYGTLPLPLAASVQEQGGEYWHLSLELAPAQRGVELDAATMTAAGARFERYEVRRLAA